MNLLVLKVVQFLVSPLKKDYSHSTLETTQPIQWPTKWLLSSIHEHQPCIGPRFLSSSSKLLGHARNSTNSVWCPPNSLCRPCNHSCHPFSQATHLLEQPDRWLTRKQFDPLGGDEFHILLMVLSMKIVSTTTWARNILEDQGGLMSNNHIAFCHLRSWTPSWVNLLTTVQPCTKFPIYL